MNATELWQLSPEQFNEWRRENDYPRIWALLVASLPHFDDWMAEQKIEKSVIFQIGIARFISSRCVLSLCVYMSDDKVRLYESASSALESLRKSGLIRSETRFEPYSMWLAGKHGNDEVKRVQSLLSVSENNKGEAQVLGKHRLLNIGGVTLKSPIISGRLLDFTCLDELSLDGAVNNSKVYLWHCSAKGVRVNGGVIGLDLFDSLLWDHRAWAKKRELALEDGVFQDFTIECEEIRFHSSRAVLKNFSVSAKNFDATMEHTNLDKVEVVYNDNGRIDHNEASKLYRNAKRLFSSVGDTVDAGECYYKEKLHEMKSLASPRELFRERWLRSGPMTKCWLSLLCYLKCAQVHQLHHLGVWGASHQKPADVDGGDPAGDPDLFPGTGVCNPRPSGALPLFQHRHLRDPGLWGHLPDLLAAATAVGHRSLLRHVPDRSLPRGFCLENQAVLTGAPTRVPSVPASGVLLLSSHPSRLSRRPCLTQRRWSDFI